uniref:Uncharacterized protein n=2 Tax=Clytia hemisphaerica TaxID=252671 RepID=A0A7M5WVL6_9CNID
MAGRNEESNPFSFSNFVHKPDETNTDESLVVVTQEGDSCDENPFRFKNFQKKTDSLASNHSKNGKSKKLQIVEDLDSVTDIFADLPSPSVDDKSLKIKVKEEDEDIFAEDANLEGITF